MRAGFDRVLPVTDNQNWDAAEGLLINRRGVFGLAAGLPALWHAPAKAGAKFPAAGRGTMHSADADGLFANSYLFAGEQSSILIDAQLTAADANTIVSLTKATGKPLESIFITHSHPDHYLGLEVIGPAFPQAIVYSAERTLREIAATARYWPDFDNALAPVTAGPSAFSGIDFECLVLPDAESIAPLVVYLPQSRTLIAGDHCLNQQHLWLAEGRIEAWLENLERLAARWTIETILPGHGDPGGMEVLEATRDYLIRFQQAVRSGKSVDAAKAYILETFPNLRFETALDVSLPAYLKT